MRRVLSASFLALVMLLAGAWSGGMLAASPAGETAKQDAAQPLLVAQESGPQRQPESLPVPQAGPPKKKKKAEGEVRPEEGFAIAVEVPLVTVDVIVVDNNGNFISELRKEHFRVLEDGVEQQVSQFESTEAPLTMVMLVESSPASYYLSYQALDTAYGFLSRLKPNDWVALVSYDIRPRILVDFTQNRSDVMQGLRMLTVPTGFREINTYDALIDTLDRLEELRGKKSVLLIGSGFDTFSRNTYDVALRKTRSTDTSIFVIGMGQWLYDYLDARGALGPIARMDYLQAQNALSTFARQSGGRAYFPRFEGELPGIYDEMAAMLRNQYSLGYEPKNRAHDGKFRKIKVELMAPDGGPLRVIDQHGKNVKYKIYAREGYYAPRESGSPSGR